MTSVTAERQNLVIACENLNFFWCETELYKIAKMWKAGKSIKMMAKHFNRDPDEILIALIHLAREHKIGKREGGLFGG